MKSRCNDKNNKSYDRYGGRGIKHNTRWNKFEEFWDDMGKGYSDELSIDRIDNNKNYCKENCKWSTMMEQSNNRNDNRFIEIEGERKTISQWARYYGHSPQTIIKRIWRGWSDIDAVVTQNKKHKPLVITYKGETKHLKEFSKEYNVPFQRAKHRLWRGWSIEKTLTTK